MGRKSSSTAELEVVRNAGGWGVRRGGESEALSYHETREQAEEAARLQLSPEGEVAVREDVVAESPDQDQGPARALVVATLMTIAVIVLIAVVALVASLTGFGA